MKKKILISILLLVCFWHFNVKAEELITDVPEVVAGEVTDVQEEVQDEEKEKDVLDVSSDEASQNVDESANVFLEENQENDVPEILDEEEKSEEKNIGVENDENPALTDEEEKEVETDDELVEVDNNKIEDEVSETVVEENTETSETVENENYDVTFTHNEYHLTIPGGSSILLSQLTKKLGIEISLSDVTEILISNNEVLKAVRVDDSNDYNIESIKSFTTEETLIIRTANGEYVIKVTDPVGDTPDHNKALEDNRDGTYTLSLTVVGDAEKKVTKVNVVVVLDTSGSMDFGAGSDSYVQNNRGGYGVVNGEYDFLYSRTGNGWTGYSYNRIGTGTYNGTVYYIDDNNIAHEYNGTRYTTTKTRMEAAQEAVNSLAQALLNNNGNGNPNDTVQLALVQFNSTASSVGNTTTSYTTFSNAVNNLSAGGGTNWEAALYRANLVNFNDRDQTYVIFVSDGNPTYYGTGNNPNGTGQETAGNITSSYNAAVDNAQTIVNNGKKFYTIGAYGNVDRMESLTTAANGSARNYYEASNTTALQNALNAIYQEIQMEGIGSVSISDGTTNSVTTSSGVSSLLDVDDTSFKYYKDNEEWEDAPEATLNSDGEVVWDLSEVGVLENGVTYKVTFVVWPSQTTLDLIADLKNDPSKYDTLDANIKKYLVKDGDGYTLLTNTTASLSFKDTREDNPQTHTETYKNPDPVNTSATQMLAVTKEWDNSIDGRKRTPVEVTVLRDGADWESFILSDDTGWTGSINIAVGIMTVKNGVVEIKAEGHDFSFGELGDDVYNWEMKSEVVHPMLVNGELTILIKQGTEVPESGTYYKIGDYYYTVGTLDEGVAKLTATNERRSWVDLEKTLDYDDDAAHFDDTIFTFDITVGEAGGEDIWFSVMDKATETLIKLADNLGLTVTGATEQTGNSAGYFVAPSGSTFTVGMKTGWNLRLLNLLVGTEYTITEKDIDSKFEFEDITYLETTDNEGVAYIPTINKDNYSVSGEVKKTNTKYGYTFINKNVNTEITVTKVWEDEEDTYSNRPNDIVLNLSDGTRVIAQPTKTDNGDGTWTYVYTGLKVYDENGNLINYKLTENQVTGYSEGVVTGDQKVGFTVTNTLIRVSTTVVKEWDDNNNQDGLRPGSVTVTLSNGETYVLDESNSWTKTVEDLPAYKNMQEVTYTWEEKEENIPEGYTPTSSVSGTTTTIKNTHIPETDDVVVTKVWEDSSNKEGLRPESIPVHLYANGEEVEVEPTIEKDGNTWTFTYKDLDVNANGKAITYTVTEDTVTNYETDIDGLTITNSRDVETTEITIKKVWSDNDDQDGLRPDTITVTLSNGDTVTITKADGWTKKVTGLQKYENGAEIVYTVVKELSVAGYEVSYSDDTLTITNTHTTETDDVVVTKVWEDSSNKEGLRPESIPVHLYANGEEVEVEPTIEKDGNTWTFTYKDLDVNANGKAITYTVTEDTVTNYETDIDGLTITNSRDVETTEITIKKVWSDNDDQDGLRPDTITVTLSNGDTVTITKADGWTKKVTGLQKYENGEEIVYTVVKELSVAGYEVSYSDDTLTITNTHTTEKDDVVVTKIWSDEDNKEGFRPEEITIHLLANGEEVDATPTIEKNGNTWTFTYKDLDVNANGKAITYTVTEDTVTNYETDIDGLTITNSREVATADVTVKKIWVDESNKEGLRPEEITVELYANGEKVDEAILSGEGDEWTHTFKDLQVYANGKEIEYTVKEITVENYDSKVDGLTITNTREVEYTSVTVKKIWEDDNDRDGIRPKKLVLALYKVTSTEEESNTGSREKVQEITLDATGNWTITVENLLKYENGKLIAYEVEEFDVPKGYTESYSEDTFTITNTHEVETKELVVTKEWDDDDNESGKRPESVTITLLANGKEYDKVVLSEENEWKHTFEGIVVYDENHKEITYTVVEENVPEGYEVSYEETEEGFIVHNVLGKGDGNPPENPQTGDNIMLYLITLLISLIGIVSGKLYLRKSN